MTAYADRKRHEYNTEIRLAWLNAAFQRSGNLPKIEDYLLPDPDGPAATDLTAEQKDAIIAANLRALRKRFER